MTLFNVDTTGFGSARHYNNLSVNLSMVGAWMKTLREEENKDRILECFWDGQLKSKEWLVAELLKLTNSIPNLPAMTATVYGGWYGILPGLLMHHFNFIHVRSVDIDPECERIAKKMNRHVLHCKFEAITEDLKDSTYEENFAFNTICEHITQEMYDTWLSKRPENATIILQSNNFEDHSEHVNCSKSMLDFRRKSGLQTIKYAGTLDMPNYQRYMIIGTKK